jgi:biotin carboxylase
VRPVVCDVAPNRADVPVSTEDADGIERAARRAGAHGLIAPGTDWPVRIAAAVAERLGLAHPISVATAALATDKVEQRTRLAEAGVPQPEWSLDSPPGYPAVVKAADRQGQRAMTIVTDPSQLPVAAARARDGSRSGRVLYERLIPGPEVTVNGFVLDGRHHALATADREHFPDVPGVALRHVYPSQHPVEVAGEVAARAAAALGIVAGPVYTQVVLGPDGAVVMEVAARLGGGHDSELVRQATGVDLAEAAVLAALALPVERSQLVPRLEAACVIQFLRAPEGELVSVSGPREATFYHPPGHVYGPLRVATDRAGCIICAAPSRQEALRRTRTACEAVRFEVR